jgi:NADPH-dependent ferric siderophore reductase
VTPTPEQHSDGHRLRDRFSVTGTVTQIEPVARRIRRIRIDGDAISALTSEPGQQIRVHLADISDPRTWLRARDLLRTYSIWRHDDGIELCVFDHEEGGPGARWAQELCPGHSVTFSRPQGSLVLQDGPYHVFAGEETASVAFAALLRALPSEAPVHGVIEVNEPDDRLPLARPLQWRYRHGRSAAASTSLVESLEQLDLPAQPGVAYLAGEARTIQLLRRHLVADRGWPRQAIRSKPFWTPGKRGLD